MCVMGTTFIPGTLTCFILPKRLKCIDHVILFFKCKVRNKRDDRQCFVSRENDSTERRHGRIKRKTRKRRESPFVRDKSGI